MAASEASLQPVARCRPCALPEARSDRPGLVVARASEGALSAAHDRGGALRHLVGRHVLHVGGNAPPMAERVFELTGSVTVELVLDRTQGGRAFSHGPLEDVVDVLDVDADRHGSAADAL